MFSVYVDARACVYFFSDESSRDAQKSQFIIFLNRNICIAAATAAAAAGDRQRVTALF